MKTRALILGVLGLGAVAFAGEHSYAAERRNANEPIMVRHEEPARYGGFNDRHDVDEHHDFEQDRRDVDRHDPDEHRDRDFHAWGYDHDDG